MTRHRDGNASTRDFIALASQTSKRDLSGFLEAWLYGKDTPPMPGHSDWKSDGPAKTVKAKPVKAKPVKAKPVEAKSAKARKHA